MSKRDMAPLLVSWDLLSVWAVVSQTLLLSQTERVQSLFSCQIANEGNERSFCSSLDGPFLAASANRINHHFSYCIRF